MQKGEVRNPFVVYILGMVTCGIYAIYWFFQVCNELNEGLGREEYSAGKEFALTVITCGAWGMWWMWRASESVVELQEKWGTEPKFDAPIVFVISIMGFAAIAMQMSLNNAWENGSPQGGGQGVV